jgi:uncharacterized membrane protein YgcG
MSRQHRCYVVVPILFVLTMSNLIAIVNGQTCEVVVENGQEINVCYDYCGSGTLFFYATVGTSTLCGIQCSATAEVTSVDCSVDFANNQQTPEFICPKYCNINPAPVPTTSSTPVAEPAPVSGPPVAVPVTVPSPTEEPTIIGAEPPASAPITGPGNGMGGNGMSGNGMSGGGGTMTKMMDNQMDKKVPKEPKTPKAGKQGKTNDDDNNNEDDDE